jgi:uncharacterized protein YigE (DUF2233 family)
MSRTKEANLRHHVIDGRPVDHKKATRIIISLYLILGFLSLHGQNTHYATVEYLSKSYDTYTVDLNVDTIQIFWKDENGKLIGNFAKLSEFLAKEGYELDFAMNGGIFMENGTPLGLYIYEGRTLTPLNSKTKGYGNFYMQPNGIFYIGKAKAGIVATGKFSKSSNIIYATQSGPLLVIEGKINSIFSKNSESMNIRNGVGIINEHTVVFVISEDGINFYEFASFFKDKMKCIDALYLDGAISGMYVKPTRDSDIHMRYGCMIGHIKRMK